MNSILPFKQIDLPMQLLARAETIKRKWHSVANNTVTTF